MPVSVKNVFGFANCYRRARSPLTNQLDLRATMPVEGLTIVIYDQTGKDWHFEKTFEPTWDDIVASIDRLDKFRYPWLWLFIGDETADATVDCLTIMGGDGVY
jgi:hypothetical protein